MRAGDPVAEVEKRTRYIVDRSSGMAKMAILGDPQAQKDLRITIARHWVISALLGAASESRKLRRRGVAIPRGSGVRVSEEDLTPLSSFAGTETTVRLARLPYVSAINVFAGELPELAGLVRLLEQSGAAVASGILDRIRSDASKIIARAARGRESIGSLGGVGVSPEAAIKALNTSIGGEILRNRLDTETRTALLNGFNSGAAETIKRHIADVPVMQLSEIHDRRTRGNPRGLYPNAGPHYQMDGFCAATDDPIWDRLRPPNGWNCRATIRGVPRAEAARRGMLLADGSVDTQGLRARHAEQWGYIDRGEYPDPGFS